MQNRLQVCYPLPVYRQDRLLICHVCYPLFRDKTVFNAVYRGWQGFKIAAVGSEEEVFANILTAKTVTEIPSHGPVKTTNITGLGAWHLTHALSIFSSASAIY